MNDDGNETDLPSRYRLGPKDGRRAHVPDELNCSFCRAPQAQVKKLIAGPTVYICDECVGTITRVLLTESTASAGTLSSSCDAAADRCSFCSTRRDRTWKLFSRHGCTICGECLEVCLSIMADDVKLSSHEHSASNCPVSPEEIAELQLLNRNATGRPSRSLWRKVFHR